MNSQITAGGSRSRAALQHHFEVEKELAARLRASCREERCELVPRLYAELYRRVPDHPRQSRTGTAAADETTYRSRLHLLKAFISPDVDFVEFGAGDGRFCRKVAPSVRQAVALEVCQQGDARPEEASGFRWVYYDGQKIPLPDESFDLAFSYQVLEHIHPDDVGLHFAEAARMLRPGGVYVLSTPHAFSGPHDISRHFTDRLETFHLKEWTYHELNTIMRDAGFTKIGSFLKGSPRGTLGTLFWRAVESVLGIMPAAARRTLARRCLNNVIVAAVKGPGRNPVCTS